MNSHDFAREMRHVRRERLARPQDHRNVRRLALIAKMQANEGHLDLVDRAELRALQQHFGLPDELD